MSRNINNLWHKNLILRQRWENEKWTRNYVPLWVLLRMSKVVFSISQNFIYIFWMKMVNFIVKGGLKVKCGWGCLFCSRMKMNKKFTKIYKFCMFNVSSPFTIFCISSSFPLKKFWMNNFHSNSSLLSHFRSPPPLNNKPHRNFWLFLVFTVDVF